MFESAVCDGAKQLGLQEKVAETSGVDADIRAFCAGAGHGKVALLLFPIGNGAVSTGSAGLLSLDLLVRVVDEIFFVRHGEFVSLTSVGGNEDEQNARG